MNRFRIKTQVLPEHIDNLGHVNNVQYLNWVQTVAYEHWEELTRMTTEPLGFWVVRSHNITFKNEAFESIHLSGSQEEKWKGSIPKSIDKTFIKQTVRRPSFKKMEDIIVIAKN